MTANGTYGPPQAAVDYQVEEFMRLYPNFVASGRGVVVGMVRDLTNHIFSREGALSDFQTKSSASPRLPGERKPRRTPHHMLRPMV